MERPPVGMDELVEHWTVLCGEQDLIETKHGATRLGFTLVLKFYTRYGRFPRGRAEFPDEVVEHVARQLKASAADFEFYGWAGRTIERHRGEIRSHLGFRECSVADADKLTDWLAASVAYAERDPDRVRVELLKMMREERIELPADGRVGRMVASALRTAEQNWFAAIAARLDAAAMGRVLGLAGWGEDTQGEDAEDEPEDPESVLALIKSMPGSVSLESMLTEIRKLKAARGIGLPARLFSDVVPKVLAGWRARCAIESPSHLPRCSAGSAATLLAALVHDRLREITDDLTELLIATVHRIDARAHKKVTDELVNAFKRVDGKENLLFQIAEAALSTPDGAVSQVVYPAVRGGEQTLRELVHEYKTKGPVYRRTVQTMLKASYTNHYRRGMIDLLDVLEFRSTRADHPLLAALEVIRRHGRSGNLTYYPLGEAAPRHKGIDEDWALLVYRTDRHGKRRTVRMAYEVATFRALREMLRCKEIWVVGAGRYRNPDDDLPRDFEARRVDYYRELRKPPDPAVFSGSLRREMTTALQDLNDALPDLDWVDVSERRQGAIRLTPLDAAPEPRNLRRIKNEVSRRWEAVPLIDILKEALLRTGVLDQVASAARRREHEARCAGRAPDAGDLRVRDEHRDPRGHPRGRGAHRGGRAVRAAPLPVPRGGPGPRGRHRERHLRRPRHRPVGQRLDRGRLGLHAFPDLGPEPVHRVARSLRRRGRAGVLAPGGQVRRRALPGPQGLRLRGRRHGRRDSATRHDDVVGQQRQAAPGAHPSRPAMARFWHSQALGSPVAAYRISGRWAQGRAVFGRSGGPALRRSGQRCCWVRSLGLGEVFRLPGQRVVQGGCGDGREPAVDRGDVGGHVGGVHDDRGLGLPGEDR
jgi:hypothetical protein